MKLYHGSNIEIQRISLDKCRPYKDFGRAFYLSPNRSQAEEMASFKATIEGGCPIITEYDFDDSIIRDNLLCIKDFTEYSRDWAEFIFANRKKSIPEFIHNYDIVHGPIANDKVGAQIVRLQEGNISSEQFLERLKFMKGITFQYAFCTQKAIKLLKKI